MFFFAAYRGENPLSASALRALTASALALYPAGALMRALAPEGARALELGGLGLIAASLVMALPVLASQALRVAVADLRNFSPAELLLRARVQAASYSVVGALVLLGLLYGAIASDAGWWLPRDYEAYNGLFWGTFLYLVMVPSTVLAWSRDAAHLN